MNLNLKGKVALVTGGANGVGKEIALSLAAEGATVAVNYRNSADSAKAIVHEIDSNGGRAIAVCADVVDLNAVQGMVDRVVGEFGRLDIIVNSAGYIKRQRFAESTPEDWRRQINTNLYGAIHLCHSAMPHLEGSKAGRIVCLIGDASRIGESGLALTAASRAGVIGLVKSLAKEVGRKGVTANAVSLGMIETDHERDFLQANREKLTSFYPTRRLGQPEDVAPTVALLASDKASWITGQVISVSGGFSMV